MDDEVKKYSAAWWISEVEDGLTREKDYRKAASNAQDIYEIQSEARTPFNILHSNVQTMLPVLINSSPKPSVIPRKKATTPPVAAASSIILKSAIHAHTDSNDLGQNDLKGVLLNCAEDALVTGRGHARVQMGDSLLEVVEWPWDRFVYGWAKTWQNVPWVAYVHFMTRGEASEAYGKDKVKDLAADSSSIELLESSREVPDTESGLPDLIEIYEIWCKTTGKVYHVAKSDREGFLQEPEAPPLAFTGFFDCPEPLMFLKKRSRHEPVVPYSVYRKQAEELNILTVRIAKIANALKVRGVYNASVGEDLAKVFEAGDNELVAAQNTEQWTTGNGSVEQFIWMAPIDKLIAVLMNLIQQRAAVKQTIFEITGMADIVRGQSAASETATAQQIKDKWGGLRIRRPQQAVAAFARGLVRLLGEGIAKMYTAEQLQEMSDVNLPTKEVQTQARTMLQTQQMLAQMTGQQPPPPPREVMEAANAQFTWDEVLAFLRDDSQRLLNIDIETNSTVQEELSEDKKEVGDMMNGLAQMFSALRPLVETQFMSFPAAKGLIIEAVRRLQFGEEAIKHIQQMEEPKGPQGADPKMVQKMQQEMQKMGQEIQKVGQENQQLKMEKARLEAEAQIVARQRELEKSEADLKSAFEALERAREDLQKDLQTGAKVAGLQKDNAATKLQAQFDKLRSQIEKAGQAFQSQVQEAASAKEEAGKQQENLNSMREELSSAILMLADKMAELSQAQSRPKKRTAQKDKTGKWLIEEVE